MAGTLGTVYGQVQIDTKQAVAAYAALRASNAATLYALRGGSTAFLAAGAVIGGVGLAIGAGFAVAIKSAADFERQLDFFGAVSNSTAAEMEAVRAKALQLGKDTIFSAGQIGDSFVELGKAGISAKDIVGGVGEAVAMLGAAADIPLDTAANIISSAMQTFELSADKAVHITDLLAGAANASIVEVEDLGVSLKYVGGVANSISIPIEDTINAISLLGKAGIKGSTAGTSLRQIMVSLTGTSSKAKGVLEDLGIITKDGANAFFTAAGKAKPLSEIFQILKDKTQGLTEAQRLSAFKIIFNNRALAAASILTRDGAAGFEKMNAEISKTTATEVASKRLDNLSGDVEILRGNIETLLIEAGTPFQGFLRGIVQGVTKVIQVFTSLPAGVQKAIFIFLAVSAVLLIFMGTVAVVIGTIFKFYESMILLKGGLSVVGKVAGSAMKAFRLLSLSLLTNPVFLIIAAIVLLAIGFVILYKRSETFRNIIGKVGEAFKTAMDAIASAAVFVFEWVKKNWPLLLAILAGPFGLAVFFIHKYWDQISGFFTGVWNSIVSGLSAFGTGFVNFFSALPGQIGSFVSSLVETIVGFIATLPERIAYWLGFLIGRSIRLIIDWNTAIGNLIAQMITAVINWFAQLPGRIATFFTNLYNGTVSRVTAMSVWLVNAVVALFNAVVGWFQQLPGRVASFFTNLYNTIVTKFTATKNWLAAAAQAIFNAVVNWFKALPGNIATALTNLYNTAVLKLNALKNAAAKFAKDLVDNIINGIKNLPGLVGDVFNKMLDALGNLGTQAWNKAKGIGDALWQGFKDGIGMHSPSFFEKAMWQITGTMLDETKKMRDNVAVMQNLGQTLPNIQDMITATRNAQGERINASIGASAPLVSPETVQAAVAANAGTKIELTVNNPVGETTVETLSKEATRMGQLGLLPV